MIDFIVKFRLFIKHWRGLHGEGSVYFTAWFNAVMYWYSDCRIYIGLIQSVIIDHYYSCEFDSQLCTVRDTALFVKVGQWTSVG